jgi:hypothetical protein
VGAQFGEKGCLPEHCHTPQEQVESEKTPLNAAAAGGHVAVAEKPLAAGADKNAKDEVRGHCHVVEIF